MGLIRLLLLLNIIILLIVSCDQEKDDFSLEIIKENQLTKVDLKEIKGAEKALLAWYLYAYFNECNAEQNNLKCELLDQLNIKNECSETHIDFLHNWLSNNKIIFYKLKKCPILSFDGVVQNRIQSLNYHKRSDTLIISLSASGLNNLEEKVWNIEQTETYLISGSNLIKQYGYENK